jgi:cell division ATPase FtsA
MRRHSPPQWTPELFETVGILPPGARYGSVSSALGQFEKVFSVRRYDVVEALEARAIEFAEYVRDGLAVAGIGEEFRASVFLTDTNARMTGLADVLGHMLDRPVRTAKRGFRPVANPPQYDPRTGALLSADLSDLSEMYRKDRPWLRWIAYDS